CAYYYGSTYRYFDVW
nr:immunoglobulin heavy chain junction region [Mus musculus]